MSEGDRVTELERTVAELEATVRGLTEELVDAGERIRQLEAAQNGTEESNGRRRRSRAGRGGASRNGNDGSADSSTGRSPDSASGYNTDGVDPNLVPGMADDSPGADGGAEVDRGTEATPEDVRAATAESEVESWATDERSWPMESNDGTEEDPTEGDTAEGCEDSSEEDGDDIIVA